MQPSTTKWAAAREIVRNDNLGGLQIIAVAIKYILNILITITILSVICPHIFQIAKKHMQL